MTVPAMRTLPLLLGVVVLSVATTLVFVLRESAPSPLSPLSPDDPGPAHVTSPPHPTPAEVAGATISPRDEKAREAIPTPLGPLDPRYAWILGRCLAAEDDVPLPDCLLEVSWGLPAPRRIPGATVHRTDADGEFRIALDPGRREACQLHVMHEARATLVCNWPSTAAVLNVGDLRLPHGVLVTGRVVDTAGEGRGDVSVRLTRVSTGAEERHLYGDMTTTSGEGGAFAFWMRLLPGTYAVTVTNYTLQGERRVELSPAELEHDLTLCITAEAPDDRITGIALDQNGAPAAGVPLLCPTAFDAKTDSKGRFRLVRNPRVARRPAAISVASHREFVPYHMDRPIEWGARDVRLVLQRQPGVEVQVLDASGNPLDAFSMQCYRHPDKGYSSAELEPIEVSDSKDGVVVVQGVPPGRNVIKVRPNDRARHPLDALAEFVMTEHGAPRQVVRLSRVARRAVHVVRSDGAPIAGSKLELVERIGKSLVLPADVGTIAEVPMGDGSREGLCWCRVISDVDGAAELVGPGGKTFALQLRGASHVTKVLEDVSLDVAAPLRITVPQGAVLRGTVGPAAVLATLRPLQGLRKERPMPALLLEDQEHKRSHPWASPYQFGASIADDGSFAITGIPPGSWDLAFHYAAVTGIRSLDRHETLARITDLIDGETRELHLDISTIPTTILKCQIVLGGVPIPNANVSLFGEQPEKRGDVKHAFAFTCDSNGMFEISVPAALYDVWVQLAGGDAPLTMPCGTVLVERGRTTEHRFELRSIRIELRLIGPDGGPFANRNVNLSLHPFGAERLTDAQGRLTIFPAPQAPFRVSAWPAHMNDRAAREVIRRGAKSKDPENQIIDLGLVTPPADRNELSVELRVPR